MKCSPLLLAAFGALVVVRSAGAAADPVRLTVAPADVDRLAVTGTLVLPPGTASNSHLRDAAGRTYPLQAGTDGTARFVIPQIRAGESIGLTLVEGSSAADSVSVERTASDLGISVAGRSVLAYQMDREKLPRADIDVRYKRAAYLHPVRSPSGAVVTGDFPANHPHHHGIWSSWSKVQFQGRPTNLWETVEQKGNTEFVRIDRSWGGAVQGGFIARQPWIQSSSELEGGVPGFLCRRAPGRLWRWSPGNLWRRAPGPSGGRRRRASGNLVAGNPSWILPGESSDRPRRVLTATGQQPRFCRFVSRWWVSSSGSRGQLPTGAPL